MEVYCKAMGCIEVLMEVCKQGRNGEGFIGRQGG